MELLTRRWLPLDFGSNVMQVVWLGDKPQQIHRSHFAGLIASDEGGEGLVLCYQGVAAISVHRQGGDVVGRVGLQSRQDEKVVIRLQANKSMKKSDPLVKRNIRS